MILLYSLVVLVFAIMIGLPILTYRITINKAIKSYIIPKLEEKGFDFIEYRWPGLFSTGSFKDDNFKLTVMNKNGNSISSRYVDIVYYKPSGETHKITARITSKFFFIDQVSFSREL